MQVERRAFLVVVVITTLAFVWIIRDFLMPVFWAVVLAVLFRPVFVRWMPVVREKRSLAAVMTTLTVTLLIIVPLGLLGVAVTQQAIGIYERIATGDVDLQAPILFIERTLPAFGDLLDRYGIEAESVRTEIEDAAVLAGSWIATRALAIGQDTITFVVLFILTLYFLFFFIRDSERILDWIVRALPLGDERERRLFAKFAEVSRATMKGTLVVAIVQGAIGGLLFAVLGIGAAVFWGVVMAVFSLLPVVGTGIVWVPAAIMLIATGSVWKGLILIAGGVILVGMVDNVLRPILVGHDTKMPDYLVLLTTLGGLAAFGLTGVVIGPLVGAMFLVVWEMMAEEYAGTDPEPTEMQVPPP